MNRRAKLKRDLVALAIINVSPDTSSSLVAGERVIVSIWWCVKALGYIACFAIVVGALVSVTSQ